LQSLGLAFKETPHLTYDKFAFDNGGLHDRTEYAPNWPLLNKLKIKIHEKRKIQEFECSFFQRRCKASLLQIDDINDVVRITHDSFLKYTLNKNGNAYASTLHLRSKHNLTCCLLSCDYNF